MTRRLVAVCMTLAIAMASLLVTYPMPVSAATSDNNVEWNGLFADQSSFFMTPVEPVGGGGLTIRLRTYHNDLTSANVNWYDSGNPGAGWNNWLPMHVVGRDITGTYDFWEVDAQALLSTAAIKYYRLQANDGSATTWYNANGPTCGTGTEQSCQAPDSANFWVIPGFHTPDWSKNAIFYQIFPDRFRNGDPSNDIPFVSSAPPAHVNGVCPSGSYDYGGNCAFTHSSWSQLPYQPGSGTDFFGGDLAGISQELDPYLKQNLGVNALYLNPIFQSPSDHKYDTQDYYTVDPHFGTNTGSGSGSLTNLIADAHSTTNFSGDNRMSVILDGVFNHTGDWNCWFNYPAFPCNGVLGAHQSQSSPYSSFYEFQNGWPNAFCAWSGFGSLPQLNYSSAGVRSAIYRDPTSVMRTYLSPPYNIDGWRLDVADNYSDMGPSIGGSCSIGTDNHSIWQDIRSYLKGDQAVSHGLSQFPESLILGEYWQKPTDWLGGNQWDSVMNYNGFGVPASRFFTGQNVHGEPDGYLTPSALGAWLTGTLADNNRSSQLSMMNLLGTHDTSRFVYRACISSAVGGTATQCSDPTTIPAAAYQKLQLATELQMTYVGAPSIYYGDETGLTGANDPDNRRTFDWNQADWNQSVFSTTRILTHNRQAHQAFRDGSFKVLLADDTNNVFAYGRFSLDPSTIGSGVTPSDAGIVALNNDASAHNVTLDATQLNLADGTTLTDVLSNKTYQVTNGQVTLNLAGNTGAVLVTGAPAALPPSPTAPGSASGVAAVWSNGQASLQWTAPASDPGNPVLGYTEQVFLADGTSVAPGATVSAPVCSAGSCTATISGVTSDTHYVIAVSAYNAVGNGPAVSTSLAPVSATGLTLAAPSDATAGTPFDVTVTARDANGDPLSGYTGTVHLTSSDGHALLAADHTFSSADHGSYTFTGLVLTTAGTQTVTATDTNKSTLQSVSTLTVQPGPLSTFSVSAPGSVTAGAPFTVTATALDSYGNTLTGYTGVVHFISSDGRATLPADTSFTAADNGIHTFTNGVTLVTAGTQSVTVQAVSDTTIEGQASISVGASSVGLHIQVSAPASATAGVPFPVALTVLDSNGNIETNYAGTVHINSSDGQAVLPTDIQFGSSDHGTVSVNVTLDTSGSQTIGVADIADSSISGTSTTRVAAAPASRLIVTTPSNAQAGSPFNYTVKALDPYGNQATSYTGTVSFNAPGDPQASLPGGTFVSGDLGVKTFSGTLKTSGTVTISAVDTGVPSITGTSGHIVVAPGPAATFDVTPPAMASSGSAVPVLVVAADAFGNTATGYTGSVILTSTDGAALLPARYTFTSGSGSDNGMHTFQVTFRTGGSQTVTVTDSNNTSLTGTSVAVSVTAPPTAPHLVMAGPLDQAVNLTWQAPASSGSSAITGYTVTCSPGCGSHTVSGTMLTLTGLTNGVSYTFAVAAANATNTGPTVTTAAIPTPLSITYAHSVTFSISAHDDQGHGAALAESGVLPAGLTFHDNGNGTATVAGVVSAAAGTYPITFKAGNLASPATIIVTRKQAAMVFAAANPHVVAVSGSATVSPVSLSATVKDAPDGFVGVISKATPITFQLQPVGAGSAYNCVASIAVAGSQLTAHCSIPAGVALNTYDVHVSVGGGYYQGFADSTLVVYNPSQGGATGAGSIVSPVTNARADFAFKVKRVSGTVVQGSVLYIEHRVAGDVTLRGTATALAITTGAHGAYPHTAAISGAVTLNGVTGYTANLTVSDLANPNTSLKLDQFRLQTTAPDSTPVADLQFPSSVSLPISSGNIFVGTS